MIRRASALLFAIITFITGTIMPQTTNLIDAVTNAIFGVPFTEDSVKSDFIDEITDSDISFADGCFDVGIINNLVMVFLDSETSFREKCSFVTQSGGFLLGWYASSDLYILKYIGLDTDEIEQKCEELMLLNSVVCALPCLAHQYSTDETPNDPFDGSVVWAESKPKGSNWWLEVIGAREAWDYDYCFDTENIKVGIIDAGFQLDHPDLDGKISFPSEKYAELNYPSNHGTHVAGIIAAEKNNGVGIAGVCPYAKLICVDWQPESGKQFWISDIKIIFGFIDTVKAGAKVCNFSLGSSTSIRPEKTERLNLYNWWDAKVHSLLMASLLSDGYDFLVVQSAGNGNEGHHAVDASQNGSFCAINRASVTTGTYSGVRDKDILDRIIIVAAAENDGDGTFTVASYSNIGNLVTIAAPGTNIFSCYADSNWSFMNGTSMAAPIVTGVAALVWSVSQNFTGADVKDIITDNESTGWLAEKRTDNYFDELEYKDIELVNAKLAVEEAISRVHDVGRISITVRDKDGLPHAKYATVTEADGLVTTHTALDNGMLNFVTTIGEKELNVYDAADNLVYTSSSITVSKDATTDIGIIIA